MEREFVDVDKQTHDQTEKQHCTREKTNNEELSDPVVRVLHGAQRSQQQQNPRNYN